MKTKHIYNLYIVFSLIVLSIFVLTSKNGNDELLMWTILLGGKAILFNHHANYNKIDLWGYMAIIYTLLHAFLTFLTYTI